MVIIFNMTIDVSCTVLLILSVVKSQITSQYSLILLTCKTDMLSFPLQKLRTQRTVLPNTRKKTDSDLLKLCSLIKKKKMY